MSKIISGFTLTVSGAELIQMCRDKMAGLLKRLEQLDQSLEKVSQMSEEDRELAGFKTRGGDMADEVKKKIKEAKQDLRYFTYAAEHLEPDASYRLGRDDLRVLGIVPVYR